MRLVFRRISAAGKQTVHHLTSISIDIIWTGEEKELACLSPKLRN